MEQEKMKTWALDIDKLLNFLQKITILLGAVLLILLPLIWKFGEQFLASGTEIKLGNTVLTLNQEVTSVLDIGALKMSKLFAVVCALVRVPLYWYGLKVFRDILAPMKEGRPFITGISKHIRKLAWIVFAGGAFGYIHTTVAQLFEDQICNIRQLLADGVIVDIQTTNSSSWLFLCSFLLLLLLSYVFRYGEQLQKESDETL